MKITSDLFDAYLKCPTKCWLRANGEPSIDNNYGQWMTALSASYRVAEIDRLIASSSNDVEFSPAINDVLTSKNRFTINIYD